MAVPVVAHYLDGRLLKGTTRDFSPTRPNFHVFRDEDGVGIRVRLAQLKAVFFVRSLDGDAEREDLRGFIAGPRETAHGRKVAVRFKDDEVLCGYSLASSGGEEGFFMFPADDGSNNLRVFVISSHAVEVQEHAGAEDLVRRALDTRAA